MKHSFLLLLIPFLLFSCDDDDGSDEFCFIGNGQVVTKLIPLAPFSIVETEGPINLLIDEDPTQTVIIRAESNIIDEIISEVNGETLTFSFLRELTCFETDEQIWITVAASDLKGVSVVGETVIESLDTLIVDEFFMDVEGVATVFLEGRVEEETISVEGELSLIQYDFPADRLTLNSEGVTSANVLVNNELNLNISGVANIKYRGNPTITQNVSGVLNLEDDN